MFIELTSSSFFMNGELRMSVTVVDSDFTVHLGKIIPDRKRSALSIKINSIINIYTHRNLSPVFPLATYLFKQREREPKDTFRWAKNHCRELCKYRKEIEKLLVLL